MPQFHSKIKPFLSPLEPAPPKDNVTQILTQLCNKIGLKAWETDMLISKCLEKNCVDQLFSFLEQYWVHVKRLSYLVKIYLELSNKFKYWCDLLSQNIYEDDEGNLFSDHIGQVALCIAKLMYTMCSLRLYQESPRPLRYNVEESNGKNEAVLDGAVIVLDVLRQDSNKLAKLLKTNRDALHYAVGNIPIKHMVFVLLGNFEDTLLGHIPTLIADSSKLVSSIASFLSVEDRIDSTWWSVRMMSISNALNHSTQSSFSPSPRSFSFKGASINPTKVSFGLKGAKTASSSVGESDPYDLYPVLRLPYADESRLPLDILNWFTGASGYYLSLKDNIVNEMHNGSLNKYKNSPGKEKPVTPEPHSPKPTRHVTISPLVNVSPSLMQSLSLPTTLPISKEIYDSPVPLISRVKPKQNSDGVNKVSTHPPSSPHEGALRSSPTSPTPKSADRTNVNPRSNSSPKTRPVSREGSSKFDRSRGEDHSKQTKSSPKNVGKQAKQTDEFSVEEYAVDILNDIIEAAVLRGIVNARLKRKWIKEVSRCKRLYQREIAAIRIQRLYRRFFWKKIFLHARKKLEEKRRRESEEQFSRVQQHIAHRLSMLQGRQLQKYKNSLQSLRNLMMDYVMRKHRRRGGKAR